MYQCDHSRSAKGNGLGLSIAKELVSVHKGTITAASVPGSRNNIYNHASESPVIAQGFFETMLKQDFGKVMARFASYNWNHERRKPYDDYYN